MKMSVFGLIDRLCIQSAASDTLFDGAPEQRTIKNMGNRTGRKLQARSSTFDEQAGEIFLYLI